MANKGSITYETDMGTFLDNGGGSIEDITSAFGQGGLESIDSGFTQLLTAEMDKGLSVKALSINGRAPLNDIAREIKKRIIVTLDDIADLKVLAEREGNQHRQIEANKYFEEVEKHYREMCDEVKTLAEQYNGYKDGIKGYKGEGDEKEPIYFEPRTVKVTWAGAEYKSLIQLNHGPDSSNKYASDLNNKLDAAREFWEKYSKAKSYKAECDALPTAVSGVVGTHVSNEDAKKIEGVQPGAKRDVTTDLGGKLVTETYTNPDGSTVELQKENGKIVSHKVKNSEGWLDEEVKYNEKGEPTKKITYTRKQIEEGKSLFEVTPTEYEYKNGSFSTEGKEVSDGSFYQYRTPNGQIATTNPGDEQPNMNHVADKKVNTNADKELESGSASKSDSGSASEPDSGSASESDSGSTSGSSSDTKGNSDVIERDGQKYAVASSFEQVNEVMSEHKPFMVKKGDKLVYDTPGDGWSSSSGDTYYVYDEKDKVYYELLDDGNVNKDSPIDPEVFAKGANKSWWQATGGEYGSAITDNQSRFVPGKKND